MSFHVPAFSRNELLSALPLAQLKQLRPLLTRVQLVSRPTVVRPSGLYGLGSISTPCRSQNSIVTASARAVAISMGIPG